MFRKIKKLAIVIADKTPLCHIVILNISYGQKQDILRYTNFPVF